VKYDLPEEVAVEADGPIRTVVMNRPGELNAINQDLHWALANVWRQLSADRQARVVILTGAGRAFSAGGDLDWITSFLDDPAGRYESLREGAQIIEEMIRFPLPVIAAVNGPAVGLGCSIAVLCDVVLMAETACLADPHVAVGLVAGDGGAALWPLLTPILRSREHLYTGDRIPAPKAVELGLATRTTAPDDLLPEARRLAERVAAQPPEAVQGTKRIVNMHLSQALAGPLQAGFAAEAVTMTTDDHRRRLLALRAADGGPAKDGRRRPASPAGGPTESRRPDAGGPSLPVPVEGER
jgi:enoyl-CoA hydratase